MSPSSLTARRKRFLIAALVVALVFVLLPLIDLLLLSKQVEKVNFAQPIGKGSDTWLLVASDSRADAPSYLQSDEDEQAQGERADLIFLARRSGAKLILATLPRDIDVNYQNNPATRLTLMLVFGPTRLNASLCNDIGVPAEHYMQIDMNGFVKLTDALGGVQIDVAHPMRDRDAKLNLKSGRQTLHGKQLLAFVRARSYQELIDGKWQTISAEEGANMRMEHSKIAVNEIRDKLTKTKNPFVWRKAAWSVSKDIKIDENSSWSEVLALTRGSLELHTIDSEIVSADKLHRKLTPKGEKQLRDLGFKKPCKLYHRETTSKFNLKD